MNVERVVSKLKRTYPGKAIVLNPPENPTEIVCEVAPAKDDTDFSIAIAVIDESKPHFHKKTTEFYEVLNGNLTITINQKEYVLNKGDKITIKPNEIHFAKGEETWVNCVANPAWKPEDHFLVK
jgi:mannose-6-phosphate isomerase-like protein (cupin superfamily)